MEKRYKLRTFRSKADECPLTDVPQIANGSIAQLVDQLGGAHLKGSLNSAEYEGTSNRVGDHGQTQAHIRNEKGEELAKADPTFRGRWLPVGGGVVRGQSDWKRRWWWRWRWCW